MSLTTRIATTLDAAVLSELAGATFALACPPHTKPEAIAAFIAEHFTQERFAEHLADPDCVILIAESGTESATESDTESATERGTKSATERGTESAAKGGTESATKGGTESATKGGTESATKGGTESATKGGTGSATESGTEGGTENDTDSDTDSDRGSAPDSDTDSDSGSAPDSDTDSDSGSAPDSDTDSDRGSAPDSDTDSDRGSAPGSAAGTGSGRQPVGYSLLLYGEPTDADVASSISLRPTVQLGKFYTRAEAHGTGVAAPLMQATLAEAARRPVTGIWLGVNEENTRAIRFYEKSGFAKVGRKHFLVGDRQEDDDVLERPLG